MDGEQWSFIDLISILSFIIGLENLELNKQQVNQMMNEMQNNQNAMLSKIIQQNELIIEQNEQLLKEKKND